MITILRIGHRIERDKRITTHVGLVARAFGADEIIIDTKDDRIEDNIRSVCDRFGGDFKISTGVNALRIAKKWTGLIVHLTMYGERLDDVVGSIDKKKDLLIILGAEKVPPEYYGLADFNVAVGNQPHSEVAALALLLDRYTNRKWADIDFEGKMKIYPSKNGKDVRSQDSNKLSESEK